VSRKGAENIKKIAMNLMLSIDQQSGVGDLLPANIQRNAGEGIDEPYRRQKLPKSDKKAAPVV
jgi:hypothetical protein